MDTKRFVLFVFFALLIIGSNAAYQLWWHKNHPKQVVAQNDPAKAAPGKNDPAKNAAPKDGANPAIEPDKNPNAENPVVENEAQPARFTLGSAETGSKMLVTLNSLGATVERTELPEFPNLEDFLAFDPKRNETQLGIVEKDANWNRAGYLGHLAPSLAVEKGVLVNVVGPGTPAAKAGLRVGDVIQGLAFDGQAMQLIAGPDDFVRMMLTTNPEKELKLKVRRESKDVELTATLGWEPAQVIRPEANGRPLLVVDESKHDPFSFGMRISRIDDARIDTLKPVELSDALLEAKHWEGKQIDPNTVEFVRELRGRNLRAIKRFTLQPTTETTNPTGYEIRVDVEIQNTGEAAKQVAYELDGPNGLPIEGWWYAYKNRISTAWFQSLGIRDVAIRTDGNDASLVSTIDLVKATTENPGIPLRETRLTYAGVDCQYFSAVLIPRPAEGQAPWLDRVVPKVVGAKPDAKNMAVYAKLVNVTGRLISNAQEVKPGESLKHRYDVFVGPKKPSILNQIGSENTKLDRLVYFGWPIFSYPAHILLTILHFFHGIVPNYGLNIIMLTVFVRLCLFPLSRKQAISAAMMQKLQPKIKEIKERYKDKREEVGRATQELFRQHSYNPFGGCLLALVQLPIFMGLYRALMIDVELRGAPLFGEGVRWCSNLGAPDMLLYWEPYLPTFLSGVNGYLGPYLNVLPLLNVSLFLVQQKALMPPATDEQTRMQQSVMKFMTVFMGFMFFTVASGLCLYFIVSSIWSISERKFLKRMTTDREIADAVIDEAKRTTTTVKIGRDGKRKK